MANALDREYAAQVGQVRELAKNKNYRLVYRNGQYQVVDGRKTIAWGTLDRKQEYLLNPTAFKVTSYLCEYIG